MAAKNAEAFEELLRGDPVLQAKLRAMTEAYGGDKADEGSFFGAVVVPLAAEVGLPFTFAEAREGMAEGRELDDWELEAVAGGKSYCYIIGGSDEGENEWACTTWDNGAGACDYVGISLMWDNWG